MGTHESRPRRRVVDDPAHAHFVTFSCSGRRKLLNQDRCKRIVVSFLEETRREFDGLCMGFVIMPEHVHALLRFRTKGRLSKFKQEWKRRSSVGLSGYFERTRNPVLEFITIGEGQHQVWTPKQYDFDVYSRKKAVEKLHYMHENPVRRGLVKQAVDWPFSSARWYATGQTVGVKLTHVDE
jgi:putative transposase